MEYRLETRLGDEDATKYAYGDEWYEMSLDALRALPPSKLIPLEKAMGLSIGQVFEGFAERSTLGMKALLWIARKLVHPDIERFKDFDAAVWMVSNRVVDEDGNVVEDEPDEDDDADGSPAETPAATPAAEVDADPLGDGPPEPVS